eukprot:3398324-Rhodomonas_salina.1
MAASSQSNKYCSSHTKRRCDPVLRPPPSHVLGISLRRKGVPLPTNAVQLQVTSKYPPRSRPSTRHPPRSRPSILLGHVTGGRTCGSGKVSTEEATVDSESRGVRPGPEYQSRNGPGSIIRRRSVPCAVWCHTP